jgi:hypothetical protein
MSPAVAARMAAVEAQLAAKESAEAKLALQLARVEGEAAMLKQRSAEQSLAIEALVRQVDSATDSAL